MEAALIGPLGRTILGATKITVGRAPDNTLVVSDVKASSHHAEIRPEGQYYSLVDLGSTNGTFVNEQRIYSRAPRQLQPGDIVRIGDTKFIFEMSSTPQSASYPEGSMVRAMQNTPSPPWQPFTPPSSGPQQPLTPSPSAPSESSTRKRAKVLKPLAGVGSLLGTIAAILAIAQFMGLTRIQDLFTHPTPTPIPIPIIAGPYDTKSPGCDQSMDASDHVSWRLAGKTSGLCLPNDSGTQLTQTDLTHIGEFSFITTNGYQLAPNHTMSVDLANLAPKVCAGIVTRQTTNYGSYGFYICGNGDWYILEYSAQRGTPLVLVQGRNATLASDHHTLVIVVNNSHLQMTVDGLPFTAENSDYTVTDSAAIVMNEEATLTTYQTAHFHASVTVSNFHYEQA